jgi:hypothetical protein
MNLNGYFFNDIKDIIYIKNGFEDADWLGEELNELFFFEGNFLLNEEEDQLNDINIVEYMILPVEDEIIDIKIKKK